MARRRTIVLHDYGGRPRNTSGLFNPYHKLIFPDGSERQRHAGDPWAKKAPHAYKLNPESLGVAYAGNVGEQPPEEALKQIRANLIELRQMDPSLDIVSHGEAYKGTRGTSKQASKSGRGLDEAAWRDRLFYGPIAPDGAWSDLRKPAGGRKDIAKVSAPAPMAQRGLAAFAGSKPVRGPYETVADAGPGETLTPKDMPGETAVPKSSQPPDRFAFAGPGFGTTLAARNTGTSVAATQPSPEIDATGPFELSAPTPPPIDVAALGGADKGGAGGIFSSLLSGLAKGGEDRQQPVDTSAMQQAMAQEEERRKRNVLSPFELMKMQV